MDDPYLKMRAESDQATTSLCDTIPPMLFLFYETLKSCGFTNEQAFSLTRDQLRGLLKTANEQ